MPIEFDLPVGVGQWGLVATTSDGAKIGDVRSGWMPPVTNPQTHPSSWQYVDRTEELLEQAGEEGFVTIDRFQASDYELCREVWMSKKYDWAAIRHVFRNVGDQSVQLHALLPLRCDGADSFLIDGLGAHEWDVLIQKRFKNDGPTAFRPGVRDDDLVMAEKPVGPTGELVDELDEQITQVRADPFCIIRRRGLVKNPALLMGYLSQTGHLSRLVLQFSNDSSGSVSLEHITAECELDGVLVPSGTERSSQWLVFSGGEVNQVISDFVGRVGVYHHVEPPPLPPPSVWCSFSVYGESYNEQLFSEDLNDLSKRPVPFDVILIDGGWERSRGEWNPDPELWPSGMKSAAERIASLGYRPALWTAPFTVSSDSPIAREYPNWMARTGEGKPYEYMSGFVLDTTAPGVCDYLEGLYRTLTFDWGYQYHKFDFMRGIFNNPDIRFYDQSSTRLDAYRVGLEAIRRGAGPDAYLCVCGGHYGGSIGLANAQRSGSDVRGWWEIMKPRIKQNLMRTWMHRLWHVDPDAMLLRRREVPLVEGNMGAYTLGKFNDDEVQTVVLNQYLGGQLICLGEAFRYLDEDRRALLRHAIPSIATAAVPLDPFEPTAPSQLLTRVIPKCDDLEPWHTLALINWTDDSKAMSTTLCPRVTDGLPSDRFLVSEFFSEELIGIVPAGGEVDLGAIPPHASRLLRIAPWRGDCPVLVGTDLNFSGGGVEVVEWNNYSETVKGRIATDWDYPCRVSVAFPKGGDFILTETVVPQGGGEFKLGK